MVLHRGLPRDNISTMVTSLKLFFNGIKAEGSKELHKGSFHLVHLAGGVPAVKFHYDEYGHLPSEIRSQFSVTNDTDTQTDYFDKDRFNISQSNRYFVPALRATLKRLLRFEDSMAKQNAKWAARGMSTIQRQPNSDIAEIEAMLAKIESNAQALSSEAVSA